ncbi:hypothetical protein HNQ94_000977 [Salirhabdus euzebyi]|uniref:DUF5667 domain-containing protein n=1 Tax=Salirhabdus euzebyi TaxID=394506 RepID=A0A841Q270_9BACI|nr:DUF5667 domain-containing protein [Salirhabdus euzebyi]MBB6452532.1 hypothetical protein [Salirhabdus euzebyi]
MKNKKFIPFLASTVLTSTLVFTSGPVSVFANEDQSETVELNMGELSTEQEENIVTLEGTSESTVEEEAEEVTDDTIEEVELDNEEDPSLIPGDFFYFVKMISENIRLAITIDDYKEAQLLANFAAERIAEANALLKAGETEKAEELLNDAIALQEKAGEQLPEQEADTSEEGTEGEPAENPIEETTEDLEVVVEEITEEDVVEGKLLHNVDTLLIVLQKIENPTAQQAIMKNIQKSFEKLDKKLTKLEERNAKFAEKTAKVEAKLASGQISDEEAELELTTLETELQNETDKMEAEEERDVEEINNEVVKETSKALKEEEKKEKEALKKEQEKEREAAKKAAEKEREEAKKAAEKEREEAKKAAEKQREDEKQDNE